MGLKWGGDKSSPRGAASSAGSKAFAGHRVQKTGLKQKKKTPADKSRFRDINAEFISYSYKVMSDLPPANKYWNLEGPL